MARRKYGEGTVFQRKDGRWVAQVRLENGKKQQRYFKTEKEAQVARRKMLHEQEQGTLATGPQQTLRVYLERWLEQVHKPAISINTYREYRVVVYKHLIPVLGHVQLQRLTPQQVQAFYTKKLDEGLSSKRVREFHSVLRSALGNAVKWNLIARNVCDLVTPPKLERREMQTLTPEQAQRLLQVARGHRFEALFTVAITTGMRRGELLGLHRQDIDFDAGCLYVRRSVNRVGKFGVVVSEPKTKGSRRKIMLPAFVIETLKRHQERQQVMREEAGAKWREKDIVFCNKYGDYEESAHLQLAFKRLLQSAELPDIRFHDLRHSTASFLAKLGVHPKVVQELLGHSNISMTLDTYSHLFPSTHQEAMEKLDDLFREKE